MSYIFAIPPQYQALFEAGKLIRRGALLINAEGGGIVAHLQETSALAKIAGSLVNPLAMVSQVGGLATGAISVVQNEQIKHRIETMQQMLGMMQGLQVATLATSLVGLGVSAAGTALVCQRIETLRRELQHLGEDVVAFRDEWRMTDLQNLLDRAMTRVERIGTARSRANARAVLEEADPVLHETFNAMMSRGKILMAADAISVDALRIVLDGLSISGSARTRALFLLDEPEEARTSAEAQTMAMTQLTLAMPADRLATKIADVSVPKDAALQIASIISETRHRTASIPSLIDHLAVRDIQPSAYLAAAEEEAEAPLMFFPVSEPRTPSASAGGA
ncbi:hypothetical protein [Tranquillimonas alkanivorans]|uniref:Uncharacterized protein n=1 Tax=Tranquillimonas alkanivorans TaxID=441119 RepID=A0A1I5VCA8_9RHOB|nr:hypothetical protein [Tranquillimonas alkanivorans]SFQ05042.1 hypothetical protein SAMN04488047_12913 [Tranquillimonas alkanivorans]